MLWRSETTGLLHFLRSPVILLLTGSSEDGNSGQEINPVDHFVITFISDIATFFGKITKLANIQILIKGNISIVFSEEGKIGILLQNGT